MKKFNDEKQSSTNDVQKYQGRLVYRRRRDAVIKALLFFATSISVVTTVGILYVLFSEAIPFFKQVSIWDFLTGKEWSPLFAEPQFGVLPLLCGTVMISLIALVVAIPLGTIIAIFLSEYAPGSLREIVKPILELLSAVPTVVYGYFALLVIGPKVQLLSEEAGVSSMLGAGFVMGVMIIPYVSSLAEDAMRTVPMYLREGSFAMGATRFQTAVFVVLPASLSSLVASYILAASRAVGETMIVSIAAGMQPNLSFNPIESAQTISAYIVQVSMGDLPYGSTGYQSIFAVGLVLFFMTLGFNLIGHFVKRKFFVKL